jgi:hypothetical protein
MCNFGAGSAPEFRTNQCRKQAITLPILSRPALTSKLQFVLHVPYSRFRGIGGRPLCAGSNANRIIVAPYSGCQI